MKKILIYLLAVVFIVSMCFIGAGCKAATTTTAAETTAAETTVVAEPVTLEFWHVYPQADLANIIQETVDNFMKENPNIKINVLPNDTPVYLQKLPMSFGTESPPDIFYGWGNQGNNTFVDQGFILDITEAMQEVKDQLSTGAISGFTYKDKIWGASHTTPSKMMLYNKEIFDKYNLTVPKNWDELMAICKTLKENGVIPIAFGQKDRGCIVHWHSEFVCQVTNNPKPIEWFLEPNKLDNPQFIGSLKIMRDLAQNGYVDPDALSLTDLESHAVFQNGTAAMYWAGCWNFPEMLEVLGNAPDFKKFEYGAFPLSGTEGPFIFTACAGLEGSAKTKHPEEVKKFLQYWVSNENASLFISKSFEMPSTNLQAMADAASSLDFLSRANAEYLAKLTAYTGIADFFKSVEFNVPLNDEYQRVMWEKDRTPEEAAKYLNEEYAKLFK